MSSVPLWAQTGPQSERSVVFSGRVMEEDGRPVAGATVTWHPRNGDQQTRSTDDDGVFHLGVVQPEAGTLQVEAQGREPVTERVEHALTPEFTMNIVLPPKQPKARNPTPPAARQPFEFSDGPDFAIAGITDWTAVGGHGSDATLRTSEDLARDTALLHQRELHGSSEKPGDLDREQEQQLRASLAATPRSYALQHELGELYLQAHHYGEAAPLLKAASALNGNTAEDEFEVARACAGIGDLSEARRHIAAAIASNDKAEYRRLAANIDERIGDPLAAVRDEQRAVALDPTEENYLAWGSELLLHRAIWQAADVLARGAQMYPRSSKIKAAWGAALFAGARYDEAAQRLCEASDLDPTSSEPYLLLGKAVLGSPAPLSCATETLARFVRLHPQSAEADYYDAMQMLKSHSGTAPEPLKALLHKAIELNPRYADAYLQLGILASAAHRTEDASRYFQQAIAADPAQAEAHYRLGVLYDRSGKHLEAQQEFHTHEVLAKQQADAAETERRQVKQFVVVQ